MGHGAVGIVAHSILVIRPEFRAKAGILCGIIAKKIAASSCIAASNRKEMRVIV
jgi:hypothetical protein